jgi:hypothetical protein
MLHVHDTQDQVIIFSILGTIQIAEVDTLLMLKKRSWQRGIMLVF